jgi:protein SCO1/2
MRKPAAVAALVLWTAATAAGQSLYQGGGGMTGNGAAMATTSPAVLKNIDIEQKVGAQLPLQLPLVDESGREVHLGEYFKGRPVVLNFVYYECPMLCGQVLSGMSSALRVLTFDIGREFEVVTVSFDPREGPELAAAKKKRFIEQYGRAGADAGWHFLTGSAESIEALAEAAGFRYQWDERTQQFAHAAAIMVVTPEGRLAQYLYGVEYAPKDLRLALVEASQNKLGSMVDRVLLYCYHYDPRTGKYGAVVTRVMQVAGVITIVVLGGGLLLMFKLEPKRRQAESKRPVGGGEA